MTVSTRNRRVAEAPAVVVDENNAPNAVPVDQDANNVAMKNMNKSPSNSQNDGEAVPENDNESLDQSCPSRLAMWFTEWASTHNYHAMMNGISLTISFAAHCHHHFHLLCCPSPIAISISFAARHLRLHLHCCALPL